MKSQIYILIISLATTAFSTRPWGNTFKSVNSRRQQGVPKITGGAEAPLHAFPYQVALYRSQNQRSFPYWSSGALITDRWVITTAYVANRLANNPYAILGAQFPNNPELSQQLIDIDYTIVHKSYNIQEDNANNIALLHLKTSAKVNRYVGTVMLALLNAPDFVGARLVMSGFGRIKSNVASESLRYVVVNGVSNSDCKNIVGNSIDDGNICVETTGGKGGCHWDSGAPLVDVDSGLLVGLMTVANSACDDNPKPNVFTRVSNFTRWIVDNIEYGNENHAKRVTHR